ncbi:hypothetical protein [Roseisolibacter sp. H3M3-2]|uniref:hypothetical protein n=1 Tax=Roseisolibacter sp. H3M3-2 TaxID=3031323 RepID=UPI0023DC4640|nr:hypothetical protein [Roseisolibacter sp. H3M3-2]MDF1502523.1 hypothetical protein [Roseisolibacter sp. H3M3-2]
MPSSAPLPSRPAAAPVRSRGGALAAVAGAALLAAACGGEDPFAIRATLETSLDTVVVYPLRGGQSLFPTALDLFGRSAVRPALRGGVAPNFDIAFDTDAQGRVLLYPARLVASPPGGSPRTGFQVTGTAFDALDIAPNSGYRFDSLQVVTAGQTVIVEAQGVSTSGLYCAGTSSMHAKLVVDSVARGTGAVHLRVRNNPNCGFRGLTAGVPKD